jgi:hypothetical protein
MAQETISRYTLLEKPIFEPQIPTHLLAKLNDQERYIVLTLSRMEQTQAWNVAQILIQNRAIIDTDVRVQDIDTWKLKLTSKWALIIGALAISVPVALKALFDWALAAVKHKP